MKSFQYVISNFYNQDRFKRLKVNNTTDKLIATLPYNLRRSFMFSSIKNNILFLAFNHPTSVSEFNNYKKNIILNMLECMKTEPNSCDIMGELFNITDIKAYLPKNILNKFDMREIDVESVLIPYYRERSSGNFNIDKGIYHDIFLDIKMAILKNKNEPN